MIPGVSGPTTQGNPQSPPEAKPPERLDARGSFTDFSEYETSDGDDADQVSEHFVSAYLLIFAVAAGIVFSCAAWTATIVWTIKIATRIGWLP